MGDIFNCSKPDASAATETIKVLRTCVCKIHPVVLGLLFKRENISLGTLPALAGSLQSLPFGIKSSPIDLLPTGIAKFIPCARYTCAG